MPAGPGGAGLGRCRGRRVGETPQPRCLGADLGAAVAVRAVAFHSGAAAARRLRRSAAVAHFGRCAERPRGASGCHRHRQRLSDLPPGAGGSAPVHRPHGARAARHRHAQPARPGHHASWFPAAGHGVCGLQPDRGGGNPWPATGRARACWGGSSPWSCTSRSRSVSGRAGIWWGAGSPGLRGPRACSPGCASAWAGHGIISRCSTCWHCGWRWRVGCRTPSSCCCAPCWCWWRR